MGAASDREFEARLALSGVDFAAISATTALLHFEDGTGQRYEHSGLIPKTFDEVHFPPAGLHTLQPPRPFKRA